MDIVDIVAPIFFVTVVLCVIFGTPFVVAALMDRHQRKQLKIRMLNEREQLRELQRIEDEQIQDMLEAAKRRYKIPGSNQE